MKNLKLKKLQFGVNQILERDQLKNILGGSGGPIVCGYCAHTDTSRNCVPFVTSEGTLSCYCPIDPEIACVVHPSE